MKKVLSLLVTFVFLQVQSWALSGGPQYGAVNNSVSGTYAGTLVGSVGTNGLGLFELGMPPAGLGSGTFAFFAGGGAFFGTVVALADGQKNKMSGVLKGAMTANVTLALIVGGNTGGSSVSSVQDVAEMGGQFVVKITGGSTGSIGIGSRLVGTAAVSVTASGTNPLPAGITVGNTALTVDGFQQSSQVTGQVDLSKLTQTSAAKTGG